MNKCAKCKIEFERGSGNSYCRPCHAEYMREHRPKHSELSDDQRKRANCRSYANVYKKRGLLIKSPCEDCGDENSQMHHEDYDEPLEVVWLCRSCHLTRHSPDKMTYKKLATKYA